MNTVHIPASAPYDVQIGPGLLAGLGGAVKALCPKAGRCLVVTDDAVGPLWASKALDSLEKAALPVSVYTLPHGEASKTADSLIALLNFAASERLTRADVFLALGGGMVGDLTGLAAACYMRGADYIQLPTTLLAAVDSSVGGKTAVDLPAGKNLMGAFWQPRAVLCDTDTLSTLPRADFLSGCAEVIKTAILFDPDLFALLEREGPAFGRQAVIARCVAHKRDVVAEDERDTGRRALLNLGHTLGHAVEAESGFALTHGQAVAIGTAVVCRAAAKCGLCAPEVPGRVDALLEKFGLPTHTDYPLDTLMERMLSDKKRAGGTVSVIVPEAIGRCAIRPMDRAALCDFMKAGL